MAAKTKLAEAKVAAREKRMQSKAIEAFLNQPRSDKLNLAPPEVEQLLTTTPVTTTTHTLQSADAQTHAQAFGFFFLMLNFGEFVCFLMMAGLAGEAFGQRATRCTSTDQ